MKRLYLYYIVYIYLCILILYSLDSSISNVHRYDTIILIINCSLYMMN